jgi:ribosomal protein S18 acetylase RimI-like enzyme
LTPQTPGPFRLSDTGIFLTGSGISVTAMATSIEATTARSRVEQFVRIDAGAERDALLPLFRLADDSESQVRSYYQSGELFALRRSDGTAIGIALVVPTGNGDAELKSMAVAPDWQRRGVGRRLIALVVPELRGAGYRRVTVVTANTALGELAFYQKVGFRLWRIERDLFSPARGYPEGLTENGIALRDGIWLEQLL